MTSSGAASHPSLSETGTRDDPNGANAAIAQPLVETLAHRFYHFSQQLLFQLGR
ncbi:hypothetical protein [Nostoc sp.]|uniref:hypothetical protein n=1 Tax=Nostoc sp. TaxID=1180 RepID=UPI002FF8FF69